MNDGPARPRRRDRQRDSELEKLRARRIAALLSTARTMLGIPAAPREQVLAAMAAYLSETMEEVRGLCVELCRLDEALAADAPTATEPSLPLPSDLSFFPQASSAAAAVPHDDISVGSLALDLSVPPLEVDSLLTCGSPGALHWGESTVIES
eukprot:m.242398 g.242398  ORF g.242398 m.242398 type:complete len:152 (+) comp25613_c0_seq1:218-673(+)